MTHKIQISKRLPDGAILVLGADTPEEFDQVLTMVNKAGQEHIHRMFATFAESGEAVELPVTETRPLMLGEARPVRTAASKTHIPRGGEW